jgi:hypothetical protein
MTGVEAVCQHDRIRAARGSAASEQRQRAALIRLGAAKAHRRPRQNGHKIGRPTIQTDEGIADLAQLVALI